jgi:hypothetical protein
MRRILLIVAMLLFVAPAMAVVTVTATQQAASVGCDQVVISYICDANEEVRAFALDINVSSGLIIEDITGFQTGTGAHYGIFPGKFRDFIDPADPNWSDPNYNPVAPDADPDSGNGLGSTYIAIEMGALYAAGGGPGTSGNLCTLIVKASTLPASGTLTMYTNDLRGGVVDADAKAIVPPALVLTGTAIVFPDCYPCYTGYTVGYGEWYSVGKPSCWCGSNTSPAWPYQCDGDADNTTQTFSKFRIYTYDLNLVLDNWKRKNTDPALDACADVDHLSQTFSKYRVYTYDLNKVLDNWKLKDTDFLADCPKAD